MGWGRSWGPSCCPGARSRCSSNTVLTGAGVWFAVALALLALVRVPRIAGVLLVATRIGWVVVLSVLNAQVQVNIPAWVRARAPAVYLTVFQGGMAVGAALWGADAEWTTVAGASLAAAVVLAAGSAVGWRLAVPDVPLGRSTLAREAPGIDASASTSS
ncbi:MFS transporter [Streptomyces sp. NPDC088178]|uniref:MFS transporter n=1 Tax=Streptomyces sp. NPDC088178 TaxID=3365836 RepID=UPI00381BD851